jgi:hypothetical protein
MAGAGLLMLALLAEAPGTASSVFAEARFGVEVGGQAAVAVTRWIDDATGPSFAVALRLRFGPHLGLGVAFESASGSVPDVERPSHLDRKQVSFDVQWRFDTGPSIRPWVSLGMGFGRVEVEYEDDLYRASAHAVDLFRLALGVDFLIGRQLAIGPLVRYSLGNTRLESIDDARATVPGDTYRALNTLELGLRVLVGF